MKNRSMPLLISAALNVLLALTILNIYENDTTFQSWVSTIFPPSIASPVMILTLAVGGGSGLGYLFLRRKQPSPRVPMSLPKSRMPRPGIPVSSAGSSGKVLPTGAVPGAIPKQVAYAVPPPVPSIKPSSSNSKQGTPTLSVSTSKPVVSSILSQPSPSFQASNRKDSPVAPMLPAAHMRPDVPLPTGPTIPNQQRVNPPLWQQDSRPQFPVKPDASGRTPTQPLEGGFHAVPSTILPPPPPNSAAPNRLPPPVGGNISGSVPVPQKWQPPGQSGYPQGSAGGLQRTGLEIDSSQKWAPLPNRAAGPQSPPSTIVSTHPQQPRQVPPTFQTASTRPVQPSAGIQPVPFTARPLGPPNARPQGPPPFQQQGPNMPPRPRELGPVAVPRQFRPEQDKTAGQTPARLPLTRQSWAPLSDPLSLGQIRPKPPDDLPPTVFPKPSQSSASQQNTRLSEAEQKPNEPSQQSNAVEGSSEAPGAGGSEMDWDTALDTILKTLRRDRIRDEQ